METIEIGLGRTRFGVRRGWGGNQHKKLLSASLSLQYDCSQIKFQHNTTFRLANKASAYARFNRYINFMWIVFWHVLFFYLSPPPARYHRPPLPTLPLTPISYSSTIYYENVFLEIELSIKRKCPQPFIEPWKDEHRQVRTEVIMIWSALSIRHDWAS